MQNLMNFNCQWITTCYAATFKAAECGDLSLTFINQSQYVILLIDDTISRTWFIISKHFPSEDCVDYTTQCGVHYVRLWRPDTLFLGDSRDYVSGRLPNSFLSFFLAFFFPLFSFIRSCFCYSFVCCQRCNQTVLVHYTL